MIKIFLDLLEKEWDDPAVMPSYAQLDLVLEEEDEVVGNEYIILDHKQFTAHWSVWDEVANLMFETKFWGLLVFRNSHSLTSKDIFGPNIKDPEKESFLCLLDKVAFCMSLFVSLDL